MELVILDILSSVVLRFEAGGAAPTFVRKQLAMPTLLLSVATVR